MLAQTRFNVKYIFLAFVLLVCLLIFLENTTLYENFWIKFRYHDDKNGSEKQVASIVSGISVISNSKDQLVIFEKSIFFIETSSSFNEKLFSVNQRQACAVESAAKMNPNTMVYLLFSYPSEKEIFKFTSKSEKFVNELLENSNVRLGKFDMDEYVKNTPVGSWLNEGELRKSNYLVSHTSDFIRLVTLWKFGGTYMDLDFVVIKNLDALGENFVGAESENSLNGAIINFDHYGVGHEIVDKCLLEFMMKFNGQQWSTNGPTLITNVLINVCGTNIISNMDRNNCQGFVVYPPSAFYPIWYGSWREYFEPDENGKTLNKTNFSYAIHLWNKLSAKNVIKKSIPNIPYATIARLFCPNTYNMSDDYF